MRTCLITLFLSLTILGSIATSEDRITPSKLRALSQYSAKEDGAALIVIQHGKELLRDFQNGHRAEEPLRIYSGTKFFWCMAACVAEEDHLLKLDELVADTITEWKSSKSKSAVTIRQLLNFTSGMSPMEELHEESVSNRGTLSVQGSLGASPGARFIYGPASMQVFHEVLKRKLAPKKQTPVQYLERHVLRPLGLGPQRYVPDKSGTPLLDAGFMLTADQWLKVGKLLLQNGKPVISKESLRQCLTSTSACPAFGLGVWNNRLAKDASAQELNISKLLLKKWPAQDWSDGCLCKAAPADLIACIGSHGQRIYVVPSMELIVLRTGVRGDFSDARFLRLLFGTE